MDYLDGIIIARSATFGREAYRVLWYLTEQLKFDKFSPINTGEISSDLRMKSQAVSRALRTLAREGVIERGPKVGQRNSFRFSPSIARYSPGLRSAEPGLPAGMN
jgi:DNA-binding MarR family transcriptional regulator